MRRNINQNQTTMGTPKKYLSETKDRKYAVMVVSGSAPRVIHNDYETAEKEAIRLTKQTGAISLVLVVCTEILPQSPKIHKIF